LRRGRIARERQRECRGILHIAPFCEFERRRSAPFRLSRIPEMRFAHGLRAPVDRGSFAIPDLLRQCDCALPHGPRLLHLTGTREHQGLIMPHPVFDAVLSAGARNFVLHSRLVALKKREIVTEDQKFLDFQFALRGSPQDIRCLPEPVKEDIVQSETVVPECIVRV
jgi:hypothetical protein